MQITLFSQDPPLRLGVFGLGPIDSYLFYYGYFQSPSSPVIDWYEIDTFSFNTKFAPFKFDAPDVWLDYTGPAPHYFSGRTLQNNFSDLTNYTAVGSILGKHDWDLATWYNENKDALGTEDAISYHVRNFDWVAFYTGAYHSIWSAAGAQSNATKEYYYRMSKGDPSFSFITDNGTYITNRNGSTVSAGVVAFGPSTKDEPNTPSNYNAGYHQETRHRGSQDYFNPSVQNYKARFVLRRPVASNTGETIVTLRVVVYYKPIAATVLQSSILTSLNLTDNNFPIANQEYSFTLDYTLGDFRQNIFDNGSVLDPLYLSTKFEVIATTNKEIQFKEVEVFDAEVWEANLNDPEKIADSKSNIYAYLQNLNSSNLTANGFFNKVEYLLGVDEPHTFDLYDAFKFVRQTLEESPQAHKPKLFIHYYPEYNAMRGKESAFQRLFEVVKPNPISFYTYTNSNDDVDVSMLWKTKVMDEYLHRKKETGYHDTTRFEYIPNVWKESNIGWGNPTGRELRSSIFTALAYGANAIYYEPVYSYGEVESMINEDGSLTLIGEYVRDEINPRLAGILGTTLYNAKYYGKTLTMYGGVGKTENYSREFYEATVNRDIPHTQGGIPEFMKILGFFDVGDSYIQTAGLFEDKKFPPLKYFLLNNAAGFNDEARPNVELYPLSVPYSSFSIVDVEEPVNYSENFTITQSYAPGLPAIEEGDGRLFAYGPTIATGGTLLTNETINVPLTMKYLELTIPDGKTLTVNNKYFMKHNINIGSTGSLIFGHNGFLYPASGKVINSANWSSSLFKSEHQMKVKLIWSDYTDAYGTAEVDKYKVYRAKPAPFIEIAEVGSNINEFVDTETEVYIGQLQSGIMEAEYKIIAVLKSGQTSAASNTIVYRYEAGNMEKKGNGDSEAPFVFGLQQNYPNPFNGMTKISYTIDKPGVAAVRIYDILGRIQAIPVNKYHEPGLYSFVLDTFGLSSGVYFYELSDEHFRKEVKKFVLTR